MKSRNKVKKEQAVLIFGTFSLVTKAHLAMGLKAKEEYPNADVWYIPAGVSYINGWNKDIITIDDQTRINLLRDSIQPFGFKAFAMELDGRLSGLTYDTVEYFKISYNEVIICLGMDNIEKIIDWEKGLDLAQNNTFLIYTRGAKINVNSLKILQEAKVVDFNEYADYSSSAARACYFNKDYFSLMKIVTPEVYIYLMKEYDNGNKNRSND